MSYSRNVHDMYKRDRYHCRFCRTTHGLTPHHIVYRSQGGTDDLSNLLTLCIKCHNAVHDGHLKLNVFEDESEPVIVFRRTGSW